MQQSHSCEGNRLSASQEIPRILRNPKVHHRIHKCPPPVLILSQFDPLRNPTSHFLRMHLNIILPYTPGSPKWSRSLWFPHINPIYASPLPLTRYMPGLSHSSRNVTEVTIQHCPQTKQCQHYCTQHTSSLSQSQAHSTDAIVNEQTNSKPRSAITALTSFSGFFRPQSVPVMSDVVVISFLAQLRY